MDIFSKIKTLLRKNFVSNFVEIKSYFKRNDSSAALREESLKIRKILEVSDIRINGSINFKVGYEGSLVPFWLNAQMGVTPETAEVEIQKSLEIIAAKLAAGQNLVEISQALKAGVDNGVKKE